MTRNLQAEDYPFQVSTNFGTGSFMQPGSFQKGIDFYENSGSVTRTKIVSSVGEIKWTQPVSSSNETSSSSSSSLYYSSTPNSSSTIYTSSSDAYSSSMTYTSSSSENGM